MRRILLTISILSLALAGWCSMALAARPHARPFPGDVTVSIPADAAKVALPSLALGPYSNPMDAVLAIGTRLVDLQADVTEDNAGNGGADADADDGGWDWSVEGATAHPAGASYENLYGPIARGLVDGAIATGNARLGTGASDVFAGISRPGSGLLAYPYYRIYDADIARAYARWGAHTANPALKDTLKARYDTELVVRGGAGGRARTVRNGRAGGGQGGLWPWDIHLLANDAQALAQAFPGSAAAYGAQVDSIAQVLLDDSAGLLGPGKWDYTNFAQNYHQTGLAGALRVFDASPRVDDNALATTLRDSLVNGQLPDGSWGISYGGVFYAGDAQVTAYAVLALMEYSARHSEASSRAAAFAGQQWLLGMVAAGGDVDDGGGEYAETDAEVLQALLTGDDVTPGPAPSCITAGYPCITVPVVFNRIDATPVRGYSVTLTLSGGLSLCGLEVVEDSYLSSVGGTHFEYVDNGGGSYTVDCAILGGMSGATGSGTLFTLRLAGTGTGTGTVTINSVTVRDLANGPVSGVPGAALAVTIDHTAPAAIAGLAASQWRTGNDADGTTKIDLTWPAVEAGASVEVYRKGFGSYPEYDDAGGSVPSAVGYPPAGWTAVTLAGSGLGYTDEPPTRDFWYYVAFVRDACGNVSAMSNATSGTLNYHLGDVAPPGGDNAVATVDVSDLGFNYGVTLAPASDPRNYLDVGPTTDYSVNARPTTDNRIQFEDLMMFAINHGVVSAPQFRAAPVAALASAVSLDVPTAPAPGETFAVGVRLDAAGDVQGVSLQLGWDADVAEPLSVAAGALLARQTGPALALSSRPGNVDVAVFGTGLALAGSGEAAVVTFRMKRAGDPAIGLRSVDARDVTNRPVAIGGPLAAGDVAPARTALGRVYPNPAVDGVMIHFALRGAADARVAVFDIGGRMVRTLVDGAQPAGSRSVRWDGRDDSGARMAPGFYVIRLEAGPVVQSRRVQLVR